MIIDTILVFYTFEESARTAGFADSYLHCGHSQKPILKHLLKQKFSAFYEKGKFYCSIYDSQPLAPTR